MIEATSTFLNKLFIWSEIIPNCQNDVHNCIDRIFFFPPKMLWNALYNMKCGVSEKHQNITCVQITLNIQARV